MGNQPVTSRGEGGGSLHGNLIAEDKNLSDRYEMSPGTVLGTGTATQIKKAEFKNYTKSNRGGGVAIKLYDGTAEIPPDLKTEAMILSQCDHPNIVKLYEVTKVDHRISLVLELCDGGDVLSRLPYTESQASRIVRQVTSAIAYMHGKNMMHRDVECSNILYSSTSENSEVKLVDFGSACNLEMIPGHPGAFKFLREKTGSLYVMAPEVVRGRYGPKADVWSIGVVTYTLINNGAHPIKGDTKDDLERRIIQGAVDYRGWRHSSYAKEFCQETCMVNAGFRLSAAAAMIHPWLAPSKKESSFKILPNELVVSFDLYRIAPPLKRIGLYALARTVKSSKYQHVFEALNTSNSGIISKDEFMAGFKDSGDSKEELDDLFDKLDINNNDGITYTEFTAATLEAEGELEEEQLREAFNIISSNGRYITKKDVSDIVSESLKGQNEMKVIKNKIEVRMNKFSKTHNQDKVHYPDFAEMFEHGFSNRTIDSIIETSLNEEQLNQMKEDDRIRYMEAIKEADD